MEDSFFDSSSIPFLTHLNSTPVSILCIVHSFLLIIRKHYSFGLLMISQLINHKYANLCSVIRIHIISHAEFYTHQLLCGHDVPGVFGRHSAGGRIRNFRHH